MRPDPLPNSSSRVIDASLVLTDGQKRVWLQLRWLNSKGGGCWMTAVNLAERLGYQPEAVEQTRRTLFKLGLLTKEPRPGKGNTHSWYVRLPAEAVPSVEPTPDEILRCRNALDWYLQGVTREAAREATRVVSREGEATIPNRHSALNPSDDTGIHPSRGSGTNPTRRSAISSLQRVGELLLPTQASIETPTQRHRGVGA